MDPGFECEGYPGDEWCNRDGPPGTYKCKEIAPDHDCGYADYFIHSETQFMN